LSGGAIDEAPIRPVGHLAGKRDGGPRGSVLLGGSRGDGFGEPGRRHRPVVM
jgi:hypothetical protein